MAADKPIDTDAFVQGAYAYGLDGVDEAQAFYREWSGAYDDHMVGELGNVGPDRNARRLAAHLDDTVTPILDIGCGTGLTPVYLAERSFRHIDGIDITPTMPEQVEARGAYRHVEIRLDEILDGQGTAVF